MALTTDRAHITPTDILSNPKKVVRLKTALSDGLFSSDPTDEASATQVIDECVKICGGLSETLSEILQTPFLASHTPFYWAIVNHDHNISESRVTLPPLLSKLLDLCVPQIQVEGGQRHLNRERSLNLATQADIVRAFFVEYNSDLYRAVQPYISRSSVGGCKAGSEVLSIKPREDEGDDGPRVVVSSYVAENVEKATIEFRIPKFFNRLLVDEKISFQFLVCGEPEPYHDIFSIRAWLGILTRYLWTLS
ncbi:hypothetical protein FA13DRAFT_491426 [Coprinellus micaceus]|uniref:Uncharacterized protein n=1 Tax=Coprinellus micaceus TaxID=71717 RepID=A0A4Y7SBU0_COPMI|nr:hypothetical protein FA13DRAFT_491426 [Coprinellus micaceus]